ncbi:MAG: glutamate racemase [Spirochaetota bacterium]
MINSRTDNRAIGVFDSGIGGLTVAAEISRLLPQEKIVYLGDLLHLPYGSKSVQAVLAFSKAAAGFLMSRNIKLLVIACNTATSIAKNEIERMINIPVIGVIGPGSRMACKATRNKRVGVIGTTRTISSNAYITEIQLIDPGTTVFQKPTPLLVPLIEEGWIGHPVLHMVVKEYLKFFSGKNIDTIVLGCTHYPLIKDEIGDALEGLFIVDSASTTAEMVQSTLENEELQAEVNPGIRGGVSAGKEGEVEVAPDNFEIYLTDHAHNFSKIAKMLIKKGIDDVGIVKLDYSRGRLNYNTD